MPTDWKFEAPSNAVRRVDLVEEHLQAAQRELDEANANHQRLIALLPVGIRLLREIESSADSLHEPVSE